MKLISLYEITTDVARIDRIAKELYGTEQDGTMEALLDSNPGLAAIGPFIPRGTILKVPEKPAPPPAAANTWPWE